jgi:hypothetical protein
VDDRAPPAAAHHTSINTFHGLAWIFHEMTDTIPGIGSWCSDDPYSSTMSSQSRNPCPLLWPVTRI